MQPEESKKSIVILALGVVLLLGSLLYPGREKKVRVPDKQEIIGTLKARNEVATTEITIRKMGIYDSETQFKSLDPSKWKVGRRVCVIPVDIVLRYGIDLKEISADDILIAGGDTVIITLPEPKLIDKSFKAETDRSEIVAFSTGLRDNVGETTIQEIKNLAFEDVMGQEMEIRDKMSSEIKNNTEILFTSILKQMNLTPIFKYKK